MHACPWLWKIAKAEPPTAATRSASSKTMLAPLPPNSSWTRFRFPADASTIRRPTPVDPVKAILSMPRCPARCAPALAPKPGTMLTTPGGNPTSAISSATRKEERGVSSAGLRTTVFPAASAGANRHDASLSGAFHGVITAVTPAGSHVTCCA